ncbi:hypothetical protein HK100_007978, partial [Physocladia obscura]
SRSQTQWILHLPTTTTRRRLPCRPPSMLFTPPAFGTIPPLLTTPSHFSTAIPSLLSQWPCLCLLTPLF